MITVVGLGFVGLTTALGFSHKKYKVYGFDIDQKRRSLIKKGRVPFFEPHLEAVLKQNLNKKFWVAKSLGEAVSQSEVVFYCVGTPSRADGRANLTYLLRAIKETLKWVKKGDYKVLVVKSTVPPSTTKDKVIPFVESLGFKVGQDVGVVNNPEFLREGYAWEDFIKPDRIIVGVGDEKAAQIIESLYRPFGAPVHKVSFNSGEFAKYLSNAFFASLISFSNEMSMIAHQIGEIEITKTFKILHQDKRWFGAPAGVSSYAYPGCGFGGYCLPKDVEGITAKAREKKIKPRFLEAIISVNLKIKDFWVDKIAVEVSPKKTLGILGLSFKPGSNDVREAPAKYFVKNLLKRGYRKILAYDPMANQEFKEEYQLPIKYEKNLKDLVKKCDVLVLLTAWKEFKEKKDLFEGKKLYDLRYFL